MLNERNKNIPKLMRAVMNELISVMKVNKLDIGLTKRTWLDMCVPHTSMITEKVMQHITNVVESYLMMRKRVDGDNSNIRIALSRLPRITLLMALRLGTTTRWNPRGMKGAGSTN
jgi:hypothetical protein